MISAVVISINRASLSDETHPFTDESWTLRSYRTFILSTR